MRPLSDSALDGLRKTLDEPDLAGTRYELLDRLGRGGMGSVFRVRDRELQREVALKVTTLPAADVAADVFYVMKLVRGVRLDEHARREPGLRPLLRVFERLCEAVAFAHDRGVLHRDLKPENVMVGDFGEALVMDWGIGVLGTPGYMSPEQERGEAASVDEQSDVYGLGAVLHFLVTGQAPGSEPRPRRIRGDMPRRLEAICLKALQSRKQDRYPRARDLAKDVARFLEGHAVTAYREGLWERGVRVVQRNPTLAALILSYLALRVVLILASR